MRKIEKEILNLLNNTSLTLTEIAEKLEKKPKTVFKALRKLFGKDKIIRDSESGRYRLFNERGQQ